MISSTPQAVLPLEVSIPPQADLSVLLLMQQASTLDQHGQAEAAEALYKQILDLQPKNFEALNFLSQIALQTGRLEPCVDLLDRAIDVFPARAELHTRRGRVLMQLKRHAEALASFEQAILIDPEFADTHDCHALALRNLNRNEEALACLERAITLRPDDADARLHLGDTLHKLKRYDEALASFDRALKLKNDFAEAFTSRGALLADLNRHEEAAESYAEAARIRPDLADAHLDEGLCRLAAGNFAKGWKKYEWRWQTARLGKSKRVFEQPLWLGAQSLTGKTILLHAEQGIEDTIQFCRYAKRVAAQGATVLLEAPACLVPLLETLEGVSQVFAEGDPLPEFDYHCPLLSLPLAFGTSLATIPTNTCYLKGDPARIAAWQQRLGNTPLLRIGLLWSDLAAHNASHAIPLQKFAALVYGRAQYISLQLDVPAADLPVLEQHGEIMRVADQLDDLSNAAALIASLDLVIAADSRIAHLACAMGKPVWLMLAFRPSWRWMLERSDSPWYPSVKLFRQPAADDWDSVVTRVARELDKWRA